MLTESMLQSHPFMHLQNDTIRAPKKNLRLDKICPQHFKALQCASLIAKTIPTLTEQLQCNEAKKLEQAKDDSNNQCNRKRTMNVVIKNLVNACPDHH